MSAGKSIWICAVQVVLLLVVCIPCIHAQVGDTALNEISIKGEKNPSNEVKLNEFSPGQKISSIDSTTLKQYQLQSMATLLAQQVPVFVKSYGFNGLATLNFRGSSAAQSAVLWNGVPIQNAALGVADISTIPVMLMNKVNIVYGSSAALWGSGNVGAALLLENDQPSFGGRKSDLAVYAGAGSFSQYMGGLKWGVSGKKVYFSAAAYGQSAQNDFTYSTTTGKEQRIQNGSLQSGSLTLQAGVNAGAGQVLNFYLWLQQYDRQVPPALFEMSSVKRQTDASVRFLTEWQRKKGANNIYSKLALIQDQVRYGDDAIMIQSQSTVQQLYWESGWRRRFEKYGQVILFVPVQVSAVNIQSGARSAQQRRAGLAGAYEVKGLKNRLSAAVNVRGEVIDGTAVFLPGANASYKIKDWLSVRANVQRTYRVPTLNELYYFPGGNTSLKPEHGWTEDVGYVVDASFKRFSFFHDVSVFNRDIKDWIYWVGGAIFTPHNIASVNSRGVETENKIRYTLGKWKLHLGVNTSYVLATTASSYIYNDGSIGRQIPYTPRYNGQLNIGLSCRGLSVNYNHTYTGYRFTVTDESSYLQPYETGNLQLMYQFVLRKHPLQLIASCNNLWSQKYQVVDQRPMPGLNWQAGLKIQR